MYYKEVSVKTIFSQRYGSVCHWSMPYIDQNTVNMSPKSIGHTHYICYQTDQLIGQQILLILYMYEQGTGLGIKNTYELLNLRAHKNSTLKENHNF